MLEESKNGSDLKSDDPKDSSNTQDSQISPKNVSADDLYRRSSQYIEWSFAPPELEKLKKQTNKNGIDISLKRFESVREKLRLENPDIFSQYNDQLSSDTLVEPISYDEEQQYLHYFSQQVIQICNHFNMPTQVKATATSFFKKFYLVHSVMEYRPKNILYTIVFLAAKLENYFISIDSFCSRIPKTTPKDILDLEFVVLLALKFTLLVHHPFRPLYGFFLDLQLVLLHPSPVMYDVTIDTIGQLYDNSKKWLNEYALLSDVSFLFTPPQIALAALYDLDKRITDQYLRLKFKHSEPQNPDQNGTPSSPDQYDVLVKTIRKCVDTAKKSVDSSKEGSTLIDKKCFFLLDPSKVLKKKIKALLAESSTQTPS